MGHIGGAKLSREGRVSGTSLSWLQTYLEAEVSPKNEGSVDGICASSSGGGRTGRCIKWVAARSRICFWSWENETRLVIMVSIAQGTGRSADNDESRLHLGAGRL